MKEIVKNIMVSFIILTILSMSISYALSNDDASQEFFTVNQQEISPGETLEISIYLNQIQWNQIKFILSSDLDISTVYANDQNGIEIEKENQDVTLEIDKTKLNLEKIVLYYQIPKEMKEGTVFTLKGSIENVEQQDESQTETTITSEITVKIVSNNNLENNTENRLPEGNMDNQKEMENGQSSNKGETETQAKQTGNQVAGTTTLQAKSTNYNSGNAGTEENVIYQGSDNNYLSSITINGYTLNKEFNKESSTYFVNVGEDVTNLEVITSVEDSSAVVCIAGADNLKEGENKILISVTAENGNVRNYRIYVTKG